MLKSYRFLLLLVILWVQACETPKQQAVLVAVAGNMAMPMQEIALLFEKEQGVKVNLSIGSSGKLTNQILNGAPYDVLISADEHYPAILYKKGLVIDDAARYAQGQLAFWSKENKGEASSLAHMKDALGAGAKMVIPNPKIAPYGQAAQAVLRDNQLWELFRQQFIIADGVSQTNHFIASGGVDLALTAWSARPLLKDHAADHWYLIPQQEYAPVFQAACAIDRNQSEEERRIAKDFVKFLQDDQVLSILKRYGYLTEDL